MTKQTEALRMAIEAMESAELVWASAGIVKMHEAIEACKYALTETQEPVIIKQENGMVLKLGYDELPNGTAFYTTPPSREWVGLSDAEVRELLTQNNHWTVFTRAIEAKLKEKNNG